MMRLCVFGHSVGCSCDPMGYSPPAPCPWNFQARILSGLAFPPGNLPEPGIEIATPASPVLADRFCDKNNRSLNC